MSQAATKERSDQFDDDIDDDELCRVNRSFVQYHLKSLIDRHAMNVMKFIKHLNSLNKRIIQRKGIVEV